MNQKLLALYGLKWNPFAPELPVEALQITPEVENFCWRIEHALVREGGFALITGDPGSGKTCPELVEGAPSCACWPSVLDGCAISPSARSPIPAATWPTLRQAQDRFLPGNGGALRRRTQTP